MEDFFLVSVLNNGIIAKRQGDYFSALKYYALAQETDPLDSRSYVNSMKIYIGTHQYEKAFRNLLLCCHFNLIENKIPEINSRELQRFNWADNKLTNKYDFNPLLIKEAVKHNKKLNDLIYRADNLTFYMGHCFVGEMEDKNYDILSKFGVDGKLLFENLESNLLGKTLNPVFRETTEEGFFLSIGFIYAHMNINFNIKTKEDAINYYLNQTTIIRKDIWNYAQFLDA